MIAGTHPGVPFHTQGNCKLGNKCAFEQMEKAGGEPQKRNNCVVVAKTTLDLTQAEDKITSPKNMRRETFCTRCQPVKSNLQNIGKNKMSRSSDCFVTEPFVKRAREERSNLWNFTTRWTKQSKSECSVVRATRKLCRLHWSKHGLGTASEHF